MPRLTKLACVILSRIYIPIFNVYVGVDRSIFSGPFKATVYRV